MDLFNNQEEFFSSLVESNCKEVYTNLPTAKLVEHSVINNECILTNTGAVIVETGAHTGRSPMDKFIVDYGQGEDNEVAWGDINKALSPAHFESIFSRVIEYLQNINLYVQDLQAGKNDNYAKSFRIITEKAWAALFVKDLLIQAKINPENGPDYTIIHVPRFLANPATDGTNTGTFVILNFQKRIILIGGTSYAGEIKKSVFSVMNRILPSKNVLPMHCSANVGKDGDTALFFGLSGTGKTTLSSSSDRSLIGDDEHGWSEDGIFNFEGGCYAKTIKLKQELEPLIWDASQRFGSVLENVYFDDQSRIIDFDNDSKTENTRAAYPLKYINGYVESGKGDHPKNIFFLTADAFGVLPPIALLSDEQAIYYFLLGYTAKLAGTEQGLGKEPEATFSTCFAEPFLPLSPIVYAKVLLEKIKQYQPKIWLINTGWTGGPYGEGCRINLPYSRGMINAVLSGHLITKTFHRENVFSLNIPDFIDGIPSSLLNQVKTWKDANYYDQVAKDLKMKMINQMDKYSGCIANSISEAGPKIS